MAYTPFGPEYQELGRIDFLLDQLARAVESGEVPLASYNAMAPRYLKRRSELVAIVTQSQTPAEETSNVSAVATPGSTSYASVSAPVSALPGPSARQHQRADVQWTTILTFLGAFLVVVAAAIFAIAVWDIMGVGGKATFMGVATVAFYVGGVLARRQGLTAGGVALTVVGSAMLLFEGWIVISGMHLQGPLPWAVLFLLCSFVYWGTEVWLSGGYFGVIGGAAQAAWWWLLGEGLGWTAPERLAAIAVVALVWQLVAVRGRENPVVGSLSRALETLSPVAMVALALGIIGDLALVGTAGPREIACAAVVSSAAAAGVLTSRLLEPPSQRLAAALLQLPLFAALLVAVLPDDHSWVVVAALAVMAIAYTLIGLFTGPEFAVAGMIAQLGLALEVCMLRDAANHTTLLVLAALALCWGIAGWALRRWLFAAEGPRKSLGDSFVFGAALLLIPCGLASVVESEAAVLLGGSVWQWDVIVALSVLATWYLLALLLSEGAIAYAGALWSFYALLAVLRWWMPDVSTETYAIWMIALAGVWTASAWPLAKRYGEQWASLTRWSGRLAVGLFAIAGTMVAIAHGLDGSLVPCLPLAAAALVWLLDAVLTQERGLWAASAGAAVLALVMGLASINVGPWITVAVLVLTGFVLGGAGLTSLSTGDGRAARIANELAFVGLATQAFVVALWLFTRVQGLWVAGSTNWFAIDGFGAAAALASLGVHAIAQSVRRRIEAGYHAGGFLLTAAVWVILAEDPSSALEFYTTSLAIYLIVAGYVHKRVSADKRFPAEIEWAAVAVGLGVPLFASLSSTGVDAWPHALWVVILSLLAIGAGIAVKSRAYFFGGTGSLALIALYQSWSVIAQVWWLVLGIVGVTMLVVALTWERQRMLIADARDAVRRSFQDWH